MAVSGLAKNILANLIGNLWTAVVSIALVPLYVRFMGIEAYGLVGFFATMQASFALLDMGLSTTLNREMARLSVQPGRTQDMHDLVRTLEMIYWSVALGIGAVVVLLAPVIAAYWVQAQQLPVEIIRQGVILMGLILVFQWPNALYSGGLLGLQRQVLLNGIAVAAATARAVGAVVILWRVSPTIQAFFLWQTAISALHTVAARVFLRRSLPAGAAPARFRLPLLRSVARFAAGTGGLALEGMVMTQQDKIILSKLVPLETFGYYSLASSVSLSLTRLVSPVVAALFPRLTQLGELRDHEAVARLYHRSCQLVAVLALPVVAVVAVFSPQVLLLWTGDATMVERTHALLTLLILGAGLNVLMHVPSVLQTAHGWLSLALRFNAIGIAVFVPLTVVMVLRMGARGAAWAWIAFSLAQILVVPQYLHRRLLPDEKWRWYVADLGAPLAVSFAAALAWRSLFGLPGSRLGMGVYLAAAYALTLVLTGLAAGEIREVVRQQIRSARDLGVPGRFNP